MDPATPIPVPGLLTFTAMARANVLAAANAQAALLTDNLKTNYLQGFDNWSQNVVRGAIPSTNPPQPPSGYTVMLDENGWAMITPGNSLVCPLPPIPTAPAVWTPPSMPEPANVRNVPQGDTMPIGYVLTAPDGGKWQKQGSPTPFGVEYYYARI